MQESSSDRSFLKKLILITAFFVLTPVALFSSVLSLISLSKANLNSSQQPGNITSSPQPGVQVYASLPTNFPAISGEIIEADARPEIIGQFLKEHNSPLAEYSQLIVETADEYDLDYRLIPAIAMKESGGCKAIPEQSFNCWGWGVHSKGTLKFSSFDEGIEFVSKGLKENYIDQGYSSVEEIMKKYANPDSTTWAEGVLYYMSQIQ